MRSDPLLMRAHDRLERIVHLVQTRLHGLHSMRLILHSLPQIPKTPHKHRNEFHRPVPSLALHWFRRCSKSLLPPSFVFGRVAVVEGGVRGRDGVVEVSLEQGVLGLGVPFAEESGGLVRDGFGGVAGGGLQAEGGEAGAGEILLLGEGEVGGKGGELGGGGLVLGLLGGEEGGLLWKLLLLLLLGLVEAAEEGGLLLLLRLLLLLIWRPKEGRAGVGWLRVEIAEYGLSGWCAGLVHVAKEGLARGRVVVGGIGIGAAEQRCAGRVVAKDTAHRRGCC